MSNLLHEKLSDAFIDSASDLLPTATAIRATSDEVRRRFAQHVMETIVKNQNEGEKLSDEHDAVTNEAWRMFTIFERGIAQLGNRRDRLSRWLRSLATSMHFVVPASDDEFLRLVANKSPGVLQGALSVADIINGEDLVLSSSQLYAALALMMDSLVQTTLVSENTSKATFTSVRPGEEVNISTYINGGSDDVAVHRTFSSNVLVSNAEHSQSAQGEGIHTQSHSPWELETSNQVENAVDASVARKKLEVLLRFQGPSTLIGGPLCNLLRYYGKEFRDGNIQLIGEKHAA